MTQQKQARASVRENDCQLRLDSYKAFISLYFLSACTTMHITEYVMEYIIVEEYGGIFSQKQRNLIN